MTRLDQEHDVIALAKELGLRGNPVEAVVRFCEKRIGGWARIMVPWRPLGAGATGSRPLAVGLRGRVFGRRFEANHRQVRGPARRRFCRFAGQT